MIPHFEKMLYDNGPLLGLLADAWLITGAPSHAPVAEGTGGWLMREMQSPEGGYYSSLEADSEHEEGKFYVWSRDEVRALLSPGQYDAFAPRFGLDGPANFEGHHWHLRVARGLAPGSEAPIDAARAKLFAAREQRVRPGRAEKGLVSWNALAIGGMAHAGGVFARPQWRDSARRALEFIRSRMWKDRRLLATYKDGRAHLNAYLDDYAFLIAALLELMQAEFSARDLTFATELADTLLDEFEDPDAGGFFFTGRSHERLYHRPKPAHDQATPSGNAVAAWGLARLAALASEQRYARAAERTPALFYPHMRDPPAGLAAMVVALSEQLSPPSVLVLRGRGQDLARWQEELAREYLPDGMVLAVAEGSSGVPAPLDKPNRPEPVNGWLCRGVPCLPPTGDLIQLKAACKEKP